MKSIVLMAAIALGLVASGSALAQGAGPGGGPRRMGPAGRMFDPKTVETISGKVADVRTVQWRRNTGVHVDVESGAGTVDVHLGPVSFLASKNLKLEKGDAIEVTGSKITLGGKPALIAQTVKKGDLAVTLRDENGIPAWSRRGTK